MAHWTADQLKAHNEKAAKKNKYGAHKVVSKGVRYDSKRELAFKQSLDMLKIPYVMKKEFVIQQDFVYCAEKVRPVKIIPDFVIMRGHISIAVVDVKGFFTDGSKLKYKLFKHYLHKLNHEIPMYFPANKKDMDETLSKILLLLGR